MRIGFSLTELLVAVAILALLATLLAVGLWPAQDSTWKNEALTTVNLLATGLTRLEADTNRNHRPLALAVDPAGLADLAHPTIAEMQARAARINLVVELCPRKVFSYLVCGDTAGDRWPYLNARLKSRGLAPDEAANYDFATYFDPNNRQLGSLANGLPVILDPHGHPYRYLVFMERMEIAQPNGLLTTERPVFYELIVAAGPDGRLDAGMPNYTTSGGFLDFGAHPENEDNLVVEVGHWSPDHN